MSDTDVGVPWRSPRLYLLLATAAVAPLDVTVVGPALPAIADAFGVSSARSGLVVTAFAAPGAVLAVVEVADGTTGLASNTVVLDYETSTSTSPQVLHRVNAGESATLSATDDGPDWTGVTDTTSPYLVSVAPSASGSYCGGTISSTTADVPSSTPDGVFDCERYGNATWEFSVDTGQEVEVRLYLGNQFSDTSEPGKRQYNVSIEGTQVLTNYDPVADVGHATGTMKSFAVTDDGDGNVTVTFDQGAAENPQVNAIEIVETEGDT